MKISAGLLLYRRKNTIEFFLVHPGGPFFAKKDKGWWTIPKGELNDGEQPLEAAIREIGEETGYNATGPFIELTPVIQKGGKKVFCWACEADFDAAAVVCNTFRMEWPPRSGKWKEYPENDKAGWFCPDEAKILINEKQICFLEEFLRRQNFE